MAGFGRMLFDAANFGDIQVLQAATLVAVCVAVVSQLLSDAAYVVLNPRIRLSASMNSRITVLLLLIWLPLVAYVMFGPSLGALGPYVLLPAIPAVLAALRHGGAQLARVMGGHARR